MAGIHTHIHIDVPYMSKEMFAEKTGIPLRTVQDKCATGELPVDKFNLQPAKAGGTYINMVKLYQMAASSEFQHPMFPKVNTGA